MIKKVEKCQATPSCPIGFRNNCRTRLVCSIQFDHTYNTAIDTGTQGANLKEANLSLLLFNSLCLLLPHFQPLQGFHFSPSRNMVTCFLTTGESETGKQRSDRLLLELLSNADRNYINNLRRRQRCCHKSVFDSIAAFMNDSVACGKNPLTQMGVGMSPVGIGAHIAELLKYSSTHSFCSSCGRIMGPIDMISVATEDNGMQCYHCSGYPSTGGMFRALGFNNGPGHGF